MLEFVDSDLYVVQDKNNFINPLLQVGSGSIEKSTGSGSGGPKFTGSGSRSSSLHFPPALIDGTYFVTVFYLLRMSGQILDIYWALH